MKYRAIYTKDVIVEAENIMEAMKKSDKALDEIHHGTVRLEPVYVYEEKDDE